MKGREENSKPAKKKTLSLDKSEWSEGVGVTLGNQVPKEITGTR